MNSSENQVASSPLSVSAGFGPEFLPTNAAPVSRELAPLDCKRPDQPGQAHLSDSIRDISDAERAFYDEIRDNR
jgi:hypothetical protein